MSKRSTKKKSGRKRPHPHLEAYKDLVAAYREEFPGMDHEKAKESTRKHWDKWKDDFGLGMK